MALSGEEKVFIKLVLQGFDKAEADRVSKQTAEQLAAGARASNERVLKLHQELSKNLYENDRKRVEQQLALEQQRAKTLMTLSQQREREETRAANAAVRAAAQQRSATSQLIADLSHLTTISRGVTDKIGSLWSTAKQLGDEMIRTSNIFKSLEGSIDGMRDASQGQIADIDLIRARNKAMQQEFKPTEDQWKLLAAFADDLGDKTGTDAADGLNELTEALAIGKEKTIEMMVGKMDLNKVYDEFAKKLGISSDMLSEQGKLAAFQEEAFERIKGKLDATGDSSLTFADNTEQAFVAVKNAWDNMMAGIGNSPFMAAVANQVAGLVDDLTFLLGIKDVQNAKKGIETEEARHDAAMAAINKTFDDAMAASYVKYGGTPPKAAAAAAPREYLRDNKGGPKKDAAAARAAAEGRKSVDALMAQIIRMNSPATQGGASLDDEVGDLLFAEMGEGRGTEDLGKEALAKFKTEAEKLKEIKDGIIGEAGGGLIARLVYGDQDPEELAATLDATTLSITQSMSGMADELMAATGGALAALMTGEAGFGEFLSKQVKAIAQRHVAEHTMKAVGHFGTAAAMALTGNPMAGAEAAAGAKEMLTAGAIAVVGKVASGAIGSMGGGGGGTTSAPSVRSGGGSASDRSTRGEPRGGDQAPVHFNMLVLPGGEERAAQEIIRVLDYRKNQTGKDWRAQS